MTAKRPSYRKQSVMGLDGPVGDASKSFLFYRLDRRALLVTLFALASSLAECVAIHGQNLATVSQFEYQAMMLKAEGTRLERERNEQIRAHRSESARVATYNSELLRVVSEFQNHTADQHHQFVSCKDCRRLAKEMSKLTRKIERGIR